MRKEAISLMRLEENSNPDSLYSNTVAVNILLLKYLIQTCAIV
jgi:hypothetical protein